METEASAGTTETRPEELEWFCECHRTRVPEKAYWFVHHDAESASQEHCESSATNLGERPARTDVWWRRIDHSWPLAASMARWVHTGGRAPCEASNLGRRSRCTRQYRARCWGLGERPHVTKWCLTIYLTTFLYLTKKHGTSQAITSIYIDYEVIINIISNLISNAYWEILRKLDKYSC